MFISSQGSKEAQGKLTGPIHLAFQAQDRTMVDRIEAVYHGPAKRSAGSVKISFTG